MTDVPTISAAISSVKSAIDIVEAIKSADRSLEKAEIKLQITELYELLVEAKDKTIEVKETLREKDDYIRTLEERLQIKEALTYGDNSYWLLQSGQQDGPFCTQCWDVDNKLVRKHHQEDADYWYCKLHGHPMMTFG